LLVLALALMALTRTAAIQVQAFGDLRERTLAGWACRRRAGGNAASQSISANRQERWPAQVSPVRDWHWQLNVEATEVATMRRLNVYVYTSADSAAPVAALVGFGARTCSREGGNQGWDCADRKSKRNSEAGPKGKPQERLVNRQSERQSALSRSALPILVSLVPFLGI